MKALLYPPRVVHSILRIFFGFSSIAAAIVTIPTFVSLFRRRHHRPKKTLRCFSFPTCVSWTMHRDWPALWSRGAKSLVWTIRERCVPPGWLPIPFRFSQEPFVNIRTRSKRQRILPATFRRSNCWPACSLRARWLDVAAVLGKFLWFGRRTTKSWRRMIRCFRRGSPIPFESKGNGLASILGGRSRSLRTAAHGRWDARSFYGLGGEVGKSKIWIYRRSMYGRVLLARDLKSTE